MQYLTGLSVPHLKVSCNMIPFQRDFVNRQNAQEFKRNRQNATNTAEENQKKNGTKRKTPKRTVHQVSQIRDT